MNLRLFMGNQAYSSWSMRGWLLLRAFGIDFEYEVVPLYTPQWDDYVERHRPAITVPLLRVEQAAQSFDIWDSLAIAEYLHECFPDAGYWPLQARQRAAARSLAAEMHSSFGALRSNMPMNVRRVYAGFAADAQTRADIERVETLWDWAMSLDEHSGPFLFGDRFTAADAFFAPLASRFRSYDVELRPRSRAYAEALLAHSATREFYAAGEAESWVLEHVEI